MTDDKEFFTKFVLDYYANGWPAAGKASGSKAVVDPALVALAYDTYHLSVQSYTVELHSKNPDHYKRAGALLHALCKTSPIVSIDWDEDTVRLSDFYNVGVSHDDAEHWNDFMTWWGAYSNYAMAFDLAFKAGCP